MKAIVKTPFFGAVDGTVHPRRFVAGDTVEGDLAEVAAREGWAEVDGAKVEAAEIADAPKPKGKGRSKAAVAAPAPAPAQDDPDQSSLV